MLNQLELDAESLEKGFDPIKEYLQGKGENLTGVDALKTKDGMDMVDDAAGAMGAIKDSGTKIQAMYKMAVARDAAFAMAGRKFLKSLGSHNQYRAIYEAQKQARLAAAP